MNITVDGVDGLDALNTTIKVTRPVSVDIQLKLYNIFIPALAIIVIFVNFIIVLSSGLILRRGQQPRSTYIFLGNVALSDLFIGIATIFGHFYPQDKRTEMICCINVGMTVSSTLVSVYSIGLIAIDRYLYILYGLSYKRYISTNRARIMVLCTWVLGTVVGYLPAMGIRNDTNNGEFCWFIILEPPNMVVATTSIGLIPLIVIIVLYSIILRTALAKISDLKKASEDGNGTQVCTLRLFRGGGKHRGSVVSTLDDSTHSQAHQVQVADVPEKPMKCKRNVLNCFKTSKSVEISPSSVYNPSRWKAIKVVLFTTGSFFVTWFPFFFASTLYAMCDPQATPRYCDNLKVAIASPLAFLGLLNSLMNPIIYAWWHNGFRESIKKIYHGFWSERCQPKLNDFKNGRGSIQKPKESVLAGISSEMENSETELRSFTQPHLTAPLAVGGAIRDSVAGRSETD